MNFERERRRAGTQLCGENSVREMPHYFDVRASVEHGKFAQVLSPEGERYRECRGIVILILQT